MTGSLDRAGGCRREFPEVLADSIASGSEGPGFADLNGLAVSWTVTLPGLSDLRVRTWSVMGSSKWR